MPLNRVLGESIGVLGDTFHVVPAYKWRDTEFFETAAVAADASFRKSGALGPIYFDEDDVLVQEYPGLNKLAFIFCRRVAGKEMYYPYVFDLPAGLVAELETAGRWTKMRTN